MLTLPLWLRSTDKNICEWNKTSKEEQWFRSLKKGSCTYTVKVRQSFHISVSDYVAHTDTHTHTLTHTHRHTHTPPPQHSCWIYLDELLGCTEACQPTATHTEIHTHMHRHTFSVSHTHTHTHTHTQTQTPQHNCWIYLDELLGCTEACQPTATHREVHTHMHRHTFSVSVSLTHTHTHTQTPQHNCWIYLEELLGCTEACQPTATHTEIHTHMHRHTFSVSHTHTHTTHTQTPQHNYWIYLDELLGCIEACWPTAHYRHLGMVNTVAAQPPATQRPQHAHASQWQPLTQCPHLFVPTVILWTRMMRMFSKKHLLYFYFFYKLCSLSLAHSYLFMQWTLHKD